MAPPRMLLVPSPTGSDIKMKNKTKNTHTKKMNCSVSVFEVKNLPEPCGRLEIAWSIKPHPYLLESCSLSDKEEGNSTILAQMKAALRRAAGAWGWE